MTESQAITFESVSIAYAGENPILKNIDLSIGYGEKVALIGLNGSGKTSLLMACVGLAPHLGVITVGKTPVRSDTTEIVRRQVGFLFNVPEDQLLFPRVVEDVAFSLTKIKLSRDEKLHQSLQILKQLGIAHLAHSTLHHLSHGQKQRVALAGALVAKPSLLLLDEPTSGLDPLGKSRLQKILKRQTSAVLMATHDLEFARGFCDRYLFLEGRSLRADWSLSQIETHWKKVIENDSSDTQDS